ncbi:MspA family porin [Nocardia sp. NPDC057440]|uniref:MspA family porin n=1 Tax=Nocardia sp. NPDC057440 TaxID=3346134 RepID=UPI00366EAABF
MNIKPVLATAVTMLGVTLASAPFAHAGGMAPHEKTVTGPNGFAFTVGHTDEAFRPIAPLNGMPTNREVFLDDTFYGHVDAPGTGTLKAGYLLACAVDITATVTLGAGVGIDAGFHLGVNASGDSTTPSASADLGPSLHAGAGIDLSITPGKIEKFEVGTKVLPSDSTGYLISRDFHLLVQNCGGPLTIRSYTIIEAQSPEADGRDAIYGDPIFL